jgi:hypothetical protein
MHAIYRQAPFVTFGVNANVGQRSFQPSIMEAESPWLIAARPFYLDPLRRAWSDLSNYNPCRIPQFPLNP